MPYIILGAELSIPQRGIAFKDLVFTFGFQPTAVIVTSPTH